MLYTIFFFLVYIQISQFLDSHGFLDYLERGMVAEENNNNLLDKLQDAIGRGQNPFSIFPTSLVDPEIITISDTDMGISGIYQFVKSENLLRPPKVD